MKPQVLGMESQGLALESQGLVLESLALVSLRRTEPVLAASQQGQ